MPPAVAAHRYHRGCRIVWAAHPIKAFVITSGQCAQHPRQRIGVIGLCGCLWVLVGGSGGGPALRPPRLTEGRKPRPKPARDRRGRQRRAANSKNRMMDVETNDQIQPRSDRGAARLAGQVDPARRCHEGRDVQRAAVLAVLPHRRMQAPARLFGRSAGLLRTELAAIPETEKAWFRAFVTARKEGLPPRPGEGARRRRVRAHRGAGSCGATRQGRCADTAGHTAQTRAADAAHTAAVAARCPLVARQRFRANERALRINSGKNGETKMDLGIAGRKAIVCASSRGLGSRLRHRLAEAGCEVVINGRDEKRAEAPPRTSARHRRKVIAGHRRCRNARRPGRAVRGLPRARHPGQQQCRPAVPRFPRT